MRYIHSARGLQGNSFTAVSLKPSIKPLRYNFVYYFISCIAAGRWPLPLHVQRPHRVLRYLIIFIVYAYLLSIITSSERQGLVGCERALLQQTANPLSDSGSGAAQLLLWIEPLFALHVLVRLALRLLRLSQWLSR